MKIEKSDGHTFIEIYWEDLKKEIQKEIIEKCGTVEEIEKNERPMSIWYEKE